METKDLGRLFVIRAPLSYTAKSHLVQRQKTWELDPPYRYSNAVVFRFRSTGLLVGWWRKSPATSLEEHFRLALNAHIVGDFGREDYDVPAENRTVQRATHVRDVSWEDMTQKERAGAYPRMAIQYPGVKDILDVTGYDDGGQTSRLDNDPF